MASETPVPYLVAGGISQFEAEFQLKKTAHALPHNLAVLSSLLQHSHPAIDMQCRTGHVTRLWAGQINNCGGNLTALT